MDKQEYIRKDKRICILRSNPVCPDSRVEKEALTLKRAGYEVLILAWDRDSNHTPIKGKLKIMDEEIDIVRFGYKASFGEGFKNIIPFLKFQVALRQFIRKNNFDVIHACDFDTAFFTSKLAHRKKAKFIFDIFDFDYSDPHNLFQRLVKKAQIKIINNAEGTIICTENRKKQIKDSTPRNLAVIHNSPNDEMIGGVDEHEENTRRSDKPKIVYVGILQDYRLLLELGEYFSENKDCELHIGGFGKFEEYFKELDKANENIFFYGRLSYPETLKLEESCDVMLAIYDPNIDNHIFAAPNKFYESLMLGKPVMMVRGTGMSSEIEKNDIGVLIDYSIDGFDKGLKKLISRVDGWDDIGEKMKFIYKKYYSWNEMSKRLLALYEKVLGE